MSDNAKMQIKRAKLIATLGPASSGTEKLMEFIAAGMNVARLNMSHGNHEQHKKTIVNVREASRRVGREVAILCDLQGPKLRVEQLNQPLLLQTGTEWLVGPSTEQSLHLPLIPTTYAQIARDCKAGMCILFDDGMLTAEVLDVHDDFVRVRIVQGGELKSNKGINLPDAEVSAPSFTEKDRADLRFGIEHGVDYFALSFVRCREDIEQIKAELQHHGSDIPVIAKIENQQAINNLDQILDAADVIMVARGDLGVEIGNHRVPLLQKRIINQCNLLGIPVITATQMLESMIQHPQPTRAEASDIANAIWDGTDAVMLSAETAAGAYAVRAIEVMSQIVCEAEKQPRQRPPLRSVEVADAGGAIMLAASLVAEKVHALHIVSVTQRGCSLRKLCQIRPQVSIIGVSNSLDVVRRMSLLWGVNPYFIDIDHESELDLEGELFARIKRDYSLQIGDKLVIARGEGEFFAKGNAHSLRVKEINSLGPVQK
jgi:pyruvate kinase